MEGGRGTVRRHARVFLTACLAASLSAGCAAGSVGPRASGGPEAAAGSDRSPTPPPSASLDLVDRMVAAGEADAAATLADSLYFAWRDSRGTADRAATALWRESRALVRAGRSREAAARLDELLERFPSAGERNEALRLLARLDIELVREPAAASLLLSHPDAIDDSGRALLRTAAGRMSAAELRNALRDARDARGASASPPGRDPDRLVLVAALARDLAAAGRADSAARLASEVLRGRAVGPERELARSIEAGGVSVSKEPVVIGAILTNSGRFAAVGGWLREGIDLALEEASAGGGLEVKLEVVDEGDDPSAIPGLVRRLEEDGAVAIVGPVRSRALVDAAAARSDPGVALMSPTATTAPPRTPGASGLEAYALWDEGRRRVDPARDLGRWLGSVVRLGASATLYASDPVGIDEALAYRAGLAAGSGTVASEPFDTDSTTFRGPIARVGAFDPRGVFVAGADAGTILQLAPQLSYFGARDVLVAGGPTWARPEVVRRLEPSPTQERIVAATMDWSDPGSGWSAFRVMYEKKYHKSLGNNVVPALGFDATKLILAALPAEPVPHPRATARALARLSNVRGATGTLTPDAATGTVERATLIRRLADRRLAPADPDSVRAWLDHSGFLEAAGLRRQRASAREAVREAAGDTTGGGGRP